MKLPTTAIFLTGLALTTATPSPALIPGSCGVCDTFPNGAIGGSAQIPLRSSTGVSSGKSYKCTTLDKTVRLNTCTNIACGLCVTFRKNDCLGEVLFSGGPGTTFAGQGARSFFCM